MTLREQIAAALAEAEDSGITTYQEAADALLPIVEAALQAEREKSIKYMFAAGQEATDMKQRIFALENQVQAERAVSNALREGLLAVDEECGKKIQAEREACAGIADDMTTYLSCSRDGHGIAAAIRARGEAKEL